MSDRNSSTSWNSPPVLPLGMRLTEMKTRDTGSWSHFFADFQNENEPEVDFLDLSDTFSRFSSEQASSERHEDGIDKPPSKSNLLTDNTSMSANPRVARIQEFVRKYKINLSKKLKPKTLVHGCQPMVQNPKTLSKYRNKVLDYYNLLRGPKEDDAEHPDIVKFRRFYNHRRPLSLSMLQNVANFDFRPNVHLSPSSEEQKKLLSPRIKSTMNQEYESCYFTPLSSLRNLADSDNLTRVRNYEQNRICFEQKYPTIDDLIQYNNSLVDDASFQQKPTSESYDRFPHSPEMSCSVAGTGISTEDTDFSNFQSGLSGVEHFFTKREASVAVSYTNSDSPIVGSHLTPQHTSHQYLSNLSENNRILKTGASAVDSCTSSNICNVDETRMNRSPQQIAKVVHSCSQFSPKSLEKKSESGDLASVPYDYSSVDRQNVANFSSTSSSSSTILQNTYNRCVVGLPDNDARTRSPATNTRSPYEIKNLNSDSPRYMENWLPYIKYVEGDTNLYKYFHVPGDSSVAENTAITSSERKTDCSIVDAPFYSDSSAHDGKIEVDCKENAITDPCSQARNENLHSINLEDSLSEKPLAAECPFSPDSFMEEISFSPDEDSDADVPRNAVLNVRVVDASPYKIFSDSSCSSSPVSDHREESKK